MRALLDKYGFDRRAHHITSDVWYYETPGGLEVYWSPPGREGQLICCIPWRSLVASISRKRRTAIAAAEGRA